MLEPVNESYVIGASDPPLIEQTIGQALSEAADQYGESEAIVRWWRVVPDGQGGYRAEGLREVVVTL